MYFSKLAILVVAASVAQAQGPVSVSDLPTCAVTPALNAISSVSGTCGTDIACVCGDSAFISSLTPLIKQDCSDADFAKALSVATQLCAQAGVTLSPIGSTSSATPETSTSESAAAPTYASATTTAPPVSLSTSYTTSASSSKNGTFTTSSIVSVVTTNAAADHGVWAAAGLLGVGALLAAL